MITSGIESADDLGIVPTNLPEINVLWERHGTTVRLTLTTESDLKDRDGDS